MVAYPDNNIPRTPRSTDYLQQLFCPRAVYLYFILIL